MTVSEPTNASRVAPAGEERGIRGGLDPTVWIAALLDAVAIVVFVSIGRSSHEEGVTLAGVASTAWPFLVGACIGWLAARVWQRPTTLVPAAVAVWLGSFVVGMVLRAVAGQGIAVSFMIVACCFLAATLFGWRLVAVGLGRLTRQRPHAPEHD
ncbi:MAG TPA: DUF3054 domain-containing protein [Acidimicrobiales bacterium]|nr:DUF3054 domain-containing protein [Acidimicrobiales bacterium]